MMAMDGPRPRAWRRPFEGAEPGDLAEENIQARIRGNL